MAAVDDHVGRGNSEVCGRDAGGRDGALTPWRSNETRGRGKGLNWVVGLRMGRGRLVGWLVVWLDGWMAGR
jgi:hypothetical protein